MAIISLPYRYLEHLTGVDHKEVLERLPMIGSEVERIEADHVDVEFFPNRPDMFSTEGVARAMKGFLGIKTGLPEYPVKPSGISFSIDPGLAEIRPYLASAVIRNVHLDEEAILSLMGLQEALHWAVGRGRSKVAIGVHDLARLEAPFRYIAAPRDRSFIPLDYDVPMTMEEILAEHPKGKAYAHIVDSYPKFPLIVDARDQVLSFPPIINGELTRVTTETRDILLDTTGTHKKAVMVAASIICTALAEAGATIESVSIEGVQIPDLSPEERVVSVSECNKLLGLDLTPDQMAMLLKRMRFGAEATPNGMVRVQVPCFRADIMHDWDIFEDVAIAYGYEKFDATMPPTFTVGRPHHVSVIAGAVRAVFCGLGYQEVIPFTLTNERVMYGQMQRESAPCALHVLHPISEDHTIVRTDILPLLLEMLNFNRHRELPQRIFATGDVVGDLMTYQKVACVSTHPSADFSEAYAIADAVCRDLSVDYTVKESSDQAFMEGRRGDIIANGITVGVFGELHPAVFTSFELEHPVAAFELDLRAVQGSFVKPDSS